MLQVAFAVTNKANILKTPRVVLCAI